MTARSLRAARGAGATVVAVLLGAVSHTIGGGSAPDAAILLAVAALGWPLATILVGRRRRPWGLAASVVLTQAALHTVFAVAGGARVPSAGGHVHGVPDLNLVAAAHTSAPLASSTPDAAMWVAHLAAALVAFAVLARGESALVAIARWVRRHAERATWSTPAPAVRARLAPVAPVLRRLPPRYLIAAPLRGPPSSPGDLRVA
ncbi:hypothetical protein ACIGCK_09810 [Microbacterium sp. NPDC078428]|uniref:hypothetical protein n=1 Tax=Microbacterium sp. NPDC078428 TaxID=3364190 RepID=UPI0037C7E1F1